jgi:hypothetical protein
LLKLNLVDLRRPALTSHSSKGSKAYARTDRTRDPITQRSDIMRRLTAVLATALLASSLLASAAEARGGGGGFGGHAGGFGGGVHMGGGGHIGGFGGGVHVGGFGGGVHTGGLGGGVRAGDLGSARRIGGLVHVDHPGYHVGIHRFGRGIDDGYYPDCYLPYPTAVIPPYCS